MAIKPIKIKQGDARAQFKSILSYGRSRSGKTRFAATFPRPRFLSEASERGWTTIETMPSDDFYEPDRPPEVWPIENAEQMMEALAAARTDIFAGKIKTLVIDSLTFYADSYFQHMFEQAKRVTPAGKAIDTRSLYGALAQHLQSLRIDIHKWPCNVIWLALERSPEPENPRGGPMLTGQSAEKFPAGCDHVFYHRSYTYNDVNPATNAPETFRAFEMRTSVFGNYLAGGRDSGMLPDPIYDPSYRQLAEHLGLSDPLT